MPAVFIREVPEEIENPVGGAACESFERRAVSRGELGDIIAVGLRELAAKDCADLRIKLSGADAELAEVGDGKGRHRPDDDSGSSARLFKDQTRRQRVFAG